MTLAAHRRRRIHRLAHHAGVPARRAPTSWCSTTCRPATAATCPTTCRSWTARSRTPTRWRGRFDEHDIAGVVHLAGLKYAGVSVEQPLEFFRANVTGTQVLLEAVAERGIAELPVLQQRVLVRHARRGDRRRGHRAAAREPVRPEQGHRRVAAARRGGGQPRPEAVLAALLQRGRLGPGRAGRPQPAQPVPQGLPRALARRGAAGVRHRLRHARRLVRARLRARGRPGRRARGRGQAPGGRQAGRARLQRRPRRGLVRARGGRHDPARDRLRRRARAARPRRPGDPARIVGAVDRIAADLDWHARYDLDDMVTSAWAAWQHQLEVHGGAPADGARLAIARA